MRTLVAILLALSVTAQSVRSQPPTFHLVEATIDDVRAAFASKQITCRALGEQYIKRIEAYDKSGPALNAVQTINRRAVQAADRLEAAYPASGPVGPPRRLPIHRQDRVEARGLPP